MIEILRLEGLVSAKEEATAFFLDFLDVIRDIFNHFFNFGLGFFFELLRFFGNFIEQPDTFLENLISDFLSFAVGKKISYDSAYNHP